MASNADIACLLICSSRTFWRDWRERQYGVWAAGVCRRRTELLENGSSLRLLVLSHRLDATDPSHQLGRDRKITFVFGTRELGHVHVVSMNADMIVGGQDGRMLRHNLAHSLNTQFLVKTRYLQWC
jgi:hypothetical protein